MLQDLLGAAAAGPKRDVISFEALKKADEVGVGY
jgi:hypothetical protein